MIQKRARDTMDQLQKPQVAIPAIGITTLTAAALVNYHTTLQVGGAYVGERWNMEITIWQDPCPSESCCSAALPS